MNKETFTYLLAHPQDIDSHQLGELAGMIDKYPYFQAARALQLKGLKKGNSILYNDALKKTAAYTADRDILFSYITSEAFVQDEISQAILKHDSAWNAIEVELEDVSQEMSVVIDNQIKEELKKAEAILNPALFEKKKQEVISLLANTQSLLQEDKSTTPVSKEEIIVPPKISEEPLPFTKQDKHSFTEWLKLSQARPIERGDEVETDIKIKTETENQNQNQDEASIQTRIKKDSSPSESIEDKKKKFQLIEKFIQESPKISPPEKNSPNTTLEIPVSEGPKSLMTETLAKVYLQQNNYEKAIQAYKILILKYPEKSGFFADQIRAIQKLTNKK